MKKEDFDLYISLVTGRESTDSIQLNIGELVDFLNNKKEQFEEALQNNVELVSIDPKEVYVMIRAILSFSSANKHLREQRDHLIQELEEIYITITDVLGA